MLLDETLRPGSVHRWLLSDLLSCGRCEGLMRSVTPRSRSRRYICSIPSANGTRCGSISIMWRIEDDVAARLTTAIDGGIITRILSAAPTTDAGEVGRPFCRLVFVSLAVTTTSG